MFAYAREYKKFGIVPSRKPQKGFPLAGVVKVVERGVKGFVYIRFSEALVLAVGKAMPQGISNENPCYLKATRTVTGTWRVSAHYLKGRASCLLWGSDSLEWVKRIHRGENDGAYSKTAQATDGR